VGGAIWRQRGLAGVCAISLILLRGLRFFHFVPTVGVLLLEVWLWQRVSPARPQDYSHGLFWLCMATLVLVPIGCAMLTGPPLRRWLESQMAGPPAVAAKAIVDALHFSDTNDVFAQVGSRRADMLIRLADIVGKDPGGALTVRSADRLTDWIIRSMTQRRINTLSAHEGAQFVEAMGSLCGALSSGDQFPDAIRRLRRVKRMKIMQRQWQGDVIRHIADA